MAIWRQRFFPWGDPRVSQQRNQIVRILQSRNAQKVPALALIERIEALIRKSHRTKGHACRAKMGLTSHPHVHTAPWQNLTRFAASAWTGIVAAITRRGGIESGRSLAFSIAAARRGSLRLSAFFDRGGKQRPQCLVNNLANRCTLWHGNGCCFPNSEPNPMIHAPTKWAYNSDKVGSTFEPRPWLATAKHQFAPRKFCSLIVHEDRLVPPVRKKNSQREYQAPSSGA